MAAEVQALQVNAFGGQIVAITTSRGIESIDDLRPLLQQVSQVAPRRYPRVTDLLLQLPPWLRAVATPQGIAVLAIRRGIVIPQALRLYFACPAISSWLKAHAETDTFLNDGWFADPPPLVRWSETQFLVIGHFAHSDTVVAVELDCADPIVAYSAESVPRAFAFPPQQFVYWLGGIARRIVDS